MKIKELEMKGAGAWARDCELIFLNYYNEFQVCYRREKDNSYWIIKFEHVAAHKLINEEFGRSGYLAKLPNNGAFFEIQDSPWMIELAKDQSCFLKKSKHYLFKFYDETLEVIAQKLTNEQLREKPNITI